MVLVVSNDLTKDAAAAPVRGSDNQHLLGGKVLTKPDRQSAPPLCFMPMRSRALLQQGGL